MPVAQRCPLSILSTVNKRGRFINTATEACSAMQWRDRLLRLSWRACDHTRSALRDRYDRSAPCQGLSSARLVSQRHICCLYAGPLDRQTSQGGRRTTCSVTGPGRHVSTPDGPIMGVACAVKGLSGVAALASDLDPVPTGWKLVTSGHIVCAESSKRGKSGNIPVWQLCPAIV